MQQETSSVSAKRKDFKKGLMKNYSRIPLKVLKLKASIHRIEQQYYGRYMGEIQILLILIGPTDKKVGMLVAQIGSRGRAFFTLLNMVAKRRTVVWKIQTLNLKTVKEEVFIKKLLNFRKN